MGPISVLTLLIRPSMIDGVGSTSPFGAGYRGGFPSPLCMNTGFMIAPKTD